MRKILFILLLLSSGLNAQTFSFECLCTYLTAADSNCDICNANIQSRLFKGILIRKNGTAFKWIDQPYIVQFQGNNATFRELIPNGENITITLAGTPFDSIPQYQDSIKCPCAGSENFFIAGPGIYFSGDTISAFDISPINELQTVDSFYISAGNLYISLDRDSVPASFVTLPVPTGAETIINAGTGISVTGSGTIGSPYIVTNTLPHIATDLTFSGASSPVTLNSSTGTDVTITAGTGISLAATSTNTTITNSAPDQTVSITGAGINVVTGTYPNFTVTGTEVGTVASVGLALPTSVFDISGSPVTSTGTLTATFDNQSANTVFAGPTTGGAATPAFRALVAADIPALPYASTLSGTTNQIAYFNSASTITSSSLYVVDVPTRTVEIGSGTTGKLKINQGSAYSQAITAGSLEFGSYATNNCWFGDNNYFDGGWKYRNTGLAALFYFQSGGFQFRTSPSGTAASASTQTTRFSINNTGNALFGVGTPSPSNRLEVLGTGLTSATFTAKFHNANGVNNALTIRDDGLVGLSTASPAQTLHVAGTARITGSDGTATTVMGRDGDGDVSSLSLSGMSISAGTLTATDGSITNELQTISNTSNSTSHTATLSNSGGSLQIIEGSGVLLTTGGTGLNGTVTIEAIDPSTTNEIQTYSASGAGPTSYDMTVSSGGTVTLAEGSGIDLTRSGNTITVASTAASAWLLDGNTITSAKRIGSNDNFDVVVETNGTDRVWFDNSGPVSIGATQLTTAALNINGLQGGIGQLIAGGSGLVTPSFYQATGSGSGSTATVFSGVISMLNGNVESLIQNTSTSGTGGVVMQLNAKTATGDPRLYMTIDGTTDWSIGIDNDDVDNLKLHRFAAPSDNNGVGTMEFGYDGTSLGVAINKTGIGTAANAHYGLDVGGKVRGDQFVNNNPTSFTTGTIALGTAAGTGPTLDTGVSEFWGNGGRLKFTSGTSPTANGVICTVTLGTEYTFEECAPIMQGRSTNAGAFNYSCSFNSGTRVITCTLVGTLTASTVYEFNLNVSGHN